MVTLGMRSATYLDVHVSVMNQKKVSNMPNIISNALYVYDNGTGSISMKVDDMIIEKFEKNSGLLVIRPDGESLRIRFEKDELSTWKIQVSFPSGSSLNWGWKFGSYNILDDEIDLGLSNDSSDIWNGTNDIYSLNMAVPTNPALCVLMDKTYTFLMED